MKYSILTLFPDLIKSYIKTSIIKKAIERNLIEVEIVDIRDFSTLKNKQIDDYQFGGGKGMLIMIEPIVRAINSIKTPKSNIILTSPQGKTFNQKLAIEFSSHEHIIIICGHYEGFDSRISAYINQEVSIGDYVLTGGELAAMVIIDSTSRCVDSVIQKESLENDSFYDGLLDHDAYTKPVEFDGQKVPDVLLSGNHQNINKYKLESKLKNTYKKRPDLLEKIKFDSEKLLILEKIKKEEV
ncbi:tRNA (guanosine(37)-N1)-methyltransferase TrmD [Spiroplasma endosymbiont of Aspidapion aeneum]|uniref:tRNA (guanosine(37)-N1)-methyltransferase TrmD n=1 Tax=Spiroplasma endosymbiont of Aspidapion aeneum TaxID=3066276 RepID=UPI00313D3778